MTRGLLSKSLWTAAAIVSYASLLALHPSLAAGPDDEAGSDDGMDEIAEVAAPPNGPLAAGRIVAVNPSVGTIAIEHAPIGELYMERMIMIFRVADPALLFGRTAGDKVRFRVERQGRSYLVTWIENSN